MPNTSIFGAKDQLIIRDGPLAAAAAVDGEVYTVPSNSKVGYRCTSITHTQGTASTSGTIMYRAITGTALADATASAVVRDLHTALSTASTAKTPVSTTPVSTVVIKPGDRIVRDSGGTQTNLVDYNATLILEPISYI